MVGSVVFGIQYLEECCHDIQHATDLQCRSAVTQACTLQPQICSYTGVYLAATDLQLRRRVPCSHRSAATQACTLQPQICSYTGAYLAATDLQLHRRVPCSHRSAVTQARTLQPQICSYTGGYRVCFRLSSLVLLFWYPMFGRMLP